MLKASIHCPSASGISSCQFHELEIIRRNAALSTQVMGTYWIFCKPPRFTAQKLDSDVSAIAQKWHCPAKKHRTAIYRTPHNGVLYVNPLL